MAAVDRQHLQPGVGIPLDHRRRRSPIRWERLAQGDRGCGHRRAPDVEVDEQHPCIERGERACQLAGKQRLALAAQGRGHEQHGGTRAYLPVGGVQHEGETADGYGRGRDIRSPPQAAELASARARARARASAGRSLAPAAWRRRSRRARTPPARPTSKPNAADMIAPPATSTARLGPDGSNGARAAETRRTSFEPAAACRTSEALNWLRTSA